MKDSDVMGGDGFPVQEHTIHVLEPIYPNKDLSNKENVEQMMDKNYKAWVNVYEEFYGEKLKFTTKEK